MQRNYGFGKRGFGAYQPHSNLYADSSNQPKPPYASPQSGSGYQPPKQNQGGFQAYRPGQAQPVNRPQGSPYSPPDVLGGGSMNERMPYPSMPYPQAPGGRLPQPRPVPGYGGGYGPGGIRTMDWRDRDADGVDDRNQAGPGMPYERMPYPSMPYPQVPGGRLPQPAGPAVTGFPTYPAPANGMINGRPVAGKGRSPQEEIDRWKAMGTWDDPRNAKARERLEKALVDYNTVPEGYFRAPDGSLAPNYLLFLDLPSVPSAPSASPNQPQRGRHAPPQAMQPNFTPPSPSFSPPQASGPNFGQMFNFQGFAPAPPPPRPPEIAPAQADWSGPPGSFNGDGQRQRVTEDFDFDEGRRIDAKIQQQMQEQFRYRDPSDVPKGVRENITRQEKQFTEQLRRDRFAQPNAERDAAVAAQEAEYQQRLQQRYGGPGFTQQAIGWDGSVMSPQQNMAQRDAFIARLNAERAPLAATAGVYQTGMAPVAPPLNRDFASMWGQAGNMVANGWTNPLAGLFG